MICGQEYGHKSTEYFIFDRVKFFLRSRIIIYFTLNKKEHPNKKNFPRNNKKDIYFCFLWYMEYNII
ncbi:MAG TPA: hypothetical protein DHU72_04365 [Rikenellaceae bacterium]|mgnify:FL=1|nr:hypothetical protein [Rikenellaceae bacterium]HCZ22669.1 hypothetical protein [Rikenellaceae bacterium]